ncbi:hypothetical protein FACS1894199_08830 [Bacteroidia bacterium]|nr:hypothetical protein FACS1894199_08830 [Bacteroidia bacterium]
MIEMENQTINGTQAPVENDNLSSLRSQSAEIEAQLKELKKELAEKDDAIDDKEFELNSTKKKLDESKKEISELKASLHNIENDYTAKSQELEKEKEKTKGKDEDLDLSKQSIGFVSEILNAKDADSRDAIDIKEKTEAVIQFVNTEVCKTFRETSSLEEDDYQGITDKIWKWGNFERKAWLKGKTVIAFVGEFSAGKTSIVNRILSQDKEDTQFALPVSSAPTTAIATYLSYGNETLVQFTDSDENLKNLPLETFIQFSKASLEKINVAKLVRHFVIKYNNQHLNKLSILDTPGFSSNDPQDETRTTEVIREADALFWVMDAHTGEINEHSVQIIKKHLEGLPLYIIINKVDGKSPNERSQIKDKVQQTMDKNGIHVEQYIEFSSKEPLEIMMDVISAIIPREQDNNILDEITDLSNELIKYYDEQITSAQTEIRNYQALINQAEATTEASQRKKDKLINKWNNNEEQIISTLGETFWNDSGRPNKIIYPNLFWELYDQKPDIFNKVVELDEKIRVAWVDYISNFNSKSECEGSVKEWRGYLKSLERLNNTFQEKTLTFERGGLSQKKILNGIPQKVATVDEKVDNKVNDKKNDTISKATDKNAPFTMIIKGKEGWQTVMGTIKTGIIHVGDKVKIGTGVVGTQKGVCMEIKKRGTNCTEARVGDFVTLRVQGLDLDLVSSGMVLTINNNK